MLIINHSHTSLKSLKIDKHRQNNDEEPSAGNFLSSVLSAAQNVTSVLRGNSTGGNDGGNERQDHKRSASDGSFFGFINDAAQPFNDHLTFVNNDSGNNNENSQNLVGEGTGTATKAADVKIAPLRSAVATLGKGELSLESLGLTPEESNPSSPVFDANNSNNFSGFSSNQIATAVGASGHPTPLLDKNDSHKVPDLTVSGPQNLAPVATTLVGSLPSFAAGSGAFNGKEQERRSRRSLIGRRSTERSRSSLMMDSTSRPLRSLSANSFSRRHRSSFSEDLDNTTTNTNGNSNGAINSTTIVSSEGTDSHPTLNENINEDSDSSDQPHPREDHDTKKHLAGFAYANKKRNQEFHKIFRSLPPNDFLLDDFSCALSKDILVQGRMYVSERNICFNSNILGWVTNLVISFDEIVGLEKRTTAVLFPNGIVVHSLHAKHVFASFISRDTVFEFLMSIWRQTNSRLDVTKQNNSDGLLEADLDNDNEDEDDQYSDSDNDGSDNESNSGFEEYSDSDENEYDELEDDDEDISSDQEFGETARKAKSVPASGDKKTSEGSGAPGDSTGVSNGGAGGDAGGNSKWPIANLGADTHGATDSKFDYEAAGEKLLVNETIHAPLGVVANLLFGDNTKWITKFITDTEKNFDLKNFGPFDNGLASGSKRVYEYIKPLNGPVGPKQTKCMCTDTIEHWDLDEHLTVITTTATPDVPSGGAFTTKTRYTLWWDEGNTTKLMLSYLIDWTGKSWFKGPIEKGTHDGQMVMSKHLIAELEKSIKKGGASNIGGAGGKAKGGKKQKGKAGGKKKRLLSTKSTSANDNNGETESNGPLGQVLGLLKTEIIPMVPVPLWAIIIIVVFALYFIIPRFFGSPNTENIAGISGNMYYTRHGKLSRDKLELMRLEEEYNIWRWLEDRSSGIDSSISGAVGRRGASINTPSFDKSKYYEQDLREAIKLTELRVRELKRVMNI